METFEQRLLEQEGVLQGRFELFFESETGGSDWWDSIKTAAPELGSILDGYVDWYEAKIIEILTAGLADPPTSVNYFEHATRLDNLILEGAKLLFVAHSQGNLFANAAYNRALTKTTAESVRVVHIAPASPTLSGPPGNHTLAFVDWVINGLRFVGSAPPVTDVIPEYSLRRPGLNGWRDVLGHGLLEIYLNRWLLPAARIKNQINNAMEVLVAPPAEASPGFFTATLVWDGGGDVDLHVSEPGGSHVYYADPVGESGYLDVDNTVANGPEHYYASCDSSLLHQGTYKVELANYAGATGRTATIQIAARGGGVLGTKSVTLGVETGDEPAYHLFDVSVGTRPSGEWFASVGGD